MICSELEREKEFRQAAENRLTGDFHTTTTTPYCSLSLSLSVYSLNKLIFVIIHTYAHCLNIHWFRRSTYINTTRVGVIESPNSTDKAIRVIDNDGKHFIEGRT